MEPDWASLPKHLLDSVLEKLVSLSDYLRFSIVCKSWYYVAKDNQIQRAKMTAPMLLICANKRHSWNLYSIVDDKVFDFQLSVPNKRYCGSSFGWLIAVEKNFAITLINPFLRVKGRRKKENSIIRLPSMRLPPSNSERRRWSRQCNHYVFKATMSADPIADAEDCIVVVIYREFCQMAFIRLGKATTWTYIDTGVDRLGTLIQEVTNVEDKFYAVDQKFRLLSFGVTAESNPNVEVVACMTRRPALSKRYLVYSIEKELLMVIRYVAYDGGKRSTVGFLVFELNFDKREWVAKDNLGDDVALFVGDSASVTVPASKSGCLSNCIYFVHDNDRNGYDIDRRYHLDFGVYNVKSKSISQPYTSHAKSLVEMTDYEPVWVKPTLNL
ncbi:F-box protein SKIP23-like [Rosa rugosa]|uniref:F-box protein SKIP23-like n=1 Tax=Rosa rugosa TaxID=74645 RepID=UPI002B40B42E|nr:F-box protein SKIP23-like [Rosa rugosa]